MIEYVIPVIGVIIIWVTYLSSITAAKKVYAAKNLGDINPYPAVLQIFNGLAWVLYGFTLPMPTSLYCFGGNFIGAIIGVYYVMIYYEFSSSDVAKRLRFVCVLLTAVYVIFYWICGYYLNNAPMIFGYFAVVVNVALYYAPLTTIILVVCSKDAASIYLPLTITFMVSSVIWSAYGIYIQNYFIAAPNILGVISASVQLLLKLCYRTPPSEMI